MMRHGSSARRQMLERLEQTWADPNGVYGWFTHVDHKSIGRRYLVTAFAFFLIGGVLAALMRLQLSRPDNTFLGPDLYNQIFTTHGTTMMFLFAVPVMQGLGIYFVPLMVGARSIAFPRLVAFSYWMFLFGGIFLYVSFLLNAGPDVGWFSYPPLAESLYTPSKRADVWAQLITFTEVASLAVAVSLITTAFKLRAPGMTLNRIPIFVWAQVVTSFMVLFAMPAVMLASTSLILDRLVGTHFFDVEHAGDALLWQHMFWFFGHPEVYIIFIPGTGMVSTIIATFSQRRMFGYLAVVLSLVSTAFMGFGLWVHHMFATGLPQLGESFFTAASIIIAVPTGTQIFCWIATMWSGRSDREDPDALDPRLLHDLHCRRPDRRHARRRPAEHAGARHLLRRRAFPLRADRRRRVSAVRRVLLLVSKNHRPAPLRAARRVGVRAVLRRLQPDVLPDAHPRPPRHAAPGLHVSGGHGLGHAESAGERRRGVDGVRRRDLRRRRDPRARGGRRRDRQSLECRHARMGHELAAAEQQLSAAADRRRTRAALGKPARSTGRRRPARRRARCRW